MGKFRGPKPGRPKKGQETKRSFHGVENEVYREMDRQAHDDNLALFNVADPSVPIISEKIEHRAMAYMRASGLTRKDIYVQLGGRFDSHNKPISGSGQYSYTHIGNIIAQPWFRKRVVELQHEAGFSGIEASIQAEVPNAVEVIVDVMNDTKASHTARLNAANAILDRGLGKPIQKVESTNKHAHLHVHEDVKEVENELLKINQELKQLGVGTGTI